MNAKRMKALAIVLLGVAIALVALALMQSDRAARIQGPEAVVVVPQAADQVWIGVGDTLWRADAQGHFIDATPVALLGLPGAPAQLLRHPAGGIVATVRDDPTLYWLDPATARVQKRLTPSWPAELKPHASRATNVALHADGRIAVATGGGHAVALFDGNGQFIARTAPDTYRFTNGLWWQGNNLWTTDTNRFELRLLDGTSLKQQRSRLLASCAQPYLGAARANARGDHVALFRHANGMVLGEVVLLDAALNLIRLPHTGEMEPRELDWLGDTVLVSDGTSRQVLRWTATGQERSAFGDDDLRARLDALKTDRLQADRLYRLSLWAGIAVFVAAFGLALWAEQQARQAQPEALRLDLSRLGTPRLTRRALMPLQWRAYGGLTGVAAALIATQTAPRWLLQAGWVPKKAHLPILIGALVVLVASLALLVRQLRRTRRLANQADLEPAFNRAALRRLERSRSLPQELREGEQVLETFMLQRFGWRWMVLTTERLLVFKVNAFDDKLASSHELSTLRAVQTVSGHWPFREPQPWIDRTIQPTLRGDWLVLLFDGAQEINGYVNAPTVIDRVVAHLQNPRQPPAQAAYAPRSKPADQPASSGRWRATLASALIPGWGQWAQRRRGTALVMFLLWSIVLLTSTVPLLWTLAGPRAAVSPGVMALSALSLLTSSGVSAWDAWRMHRPQRRRHSDARSQRGFTSKA